MAAQTSRSETTLVDNLVAAALAGDRQTVRQMLLMLDGAQRAVVAEAIDLIRQQLDPLPKADVVLMAGQADVEAGAQAVQAAFPTLGAAVAYFERREVTDAFFEEVAGTVLDVAKVQAGAQVMQAAFPTKVQAGAQALQAAFPTLREDFTDSFFEKAAGIVLDATQAATNSSND